MNQGPHPPGLLCIRHGRVLLWLGVGSWRIPCHACSVGWLRAKLELGIHGERYRISSPFFFAGRPPSLPPTRTHAKICVLHVVETTCLSPLSPLSLSVVKVEKSWVVLI